MIGKMVRRMLAAQSLSAMTVSLCLLIDEIMIGSHLGVKALAANGLASPIVLVIGAVGTLLATGVQVACSRSLGKGSQEETNAGYSTGIVTGAVFSVTFALAAGLLRVPIARLLGANEPELLKDTGDYIAGFVIGAPASMASLILVPFLQIAGQSGLLIVAVLGMTVADVVFDLLNVMVFHGGMFGMGLASALSYYTALLIAGWYFFSKKCVFRFSRAGITFRKLKELLAGGAPTMVGLGACVVFVFIMNQILLGTGADSDVMVAAFTVVTAIGNAANCISTGASGVSLTLSGVFFNEEDRGSLCTLLRELLKSAVVMGVGVTALLMAAAPALVSLFIPEPGASRDTVVFALRFFSAGLLSSCVLNVFKGAWQGTERVRLMEVFSLLECLVLPVAAALAARFIFGPSGVWCYFVAGETLALAGVFLWVWLRKKRATCRPGDLLLLREDFGVPEGNLMERDIHTLEDVMAVSREASDFCRAHGGDERLCAHIALCVEEMGVNVVTYGFSPKRKNSFSVRLQVRNGCWTMRFRDDCTAFDPISHISQAPESDGFGIRLAMRMSRDARYTYSMNLNNLILTL